MKYNVATLFCLLATFSWAPERKEVLEDEVTTKVASIENGYVQIIDHSDCLFNPNSLDIVFDRQSSIKICLGKDLCHNDLQSKGRNQSYGALGVLCRPSEKLDWDRSPKYLFDELCTLGLRFKCFTSSYLGPFFLDLNKENLDFHKKCTKQVQDNKISLFDLSKEDFFFCTVQILGLNVFDDNEEQIFPFYSDEGELCMRFHFPEETIAKVREYLKEIGLLKK